MSRTEIDHLGLLCDIGELVARLAGSRDLEGFLGQIVDMVADHLHSDVGSIYLYDESSQELVLRANRGLRGGAVGRVRLAYGEGLSGLALKELRPVRTDCAHNHPSFKAVAGIDEEAFDCFLAAPILRGLEKIGVLVVQRGELPFTERDELLLRATASQLAGAIENARLFMNIGHALGPAPVAEPVDEGISFVKGESASEGFAHAPLAIHGAARGAFLMARRRFAQYSRADFEAALVRTTEDLRSLEDRVGRRLPEVASLLFDAQLMMLKDGNFVGRMHGRIDEGVNPPEAILEVGRLYVDLLSRTPHAYIREKAHDVEDLIKRLVENLTGQCEWDTAGAGRIVFAQNLYPSDMLKLCSANVQGLVLVGGGVTSHVAILARSLQIPMVIANEPDLLKVPEKTPVLLDADVGNVYVRPDEAVVRQFRERDDARERVAAAKAGMKEETRTRDGTRVRLLANINLLSELPLARDLKAEGIGLYRSEFPFLIRPSLPSEEEQAALYSRLLEEMEGRPVTVRTLDIGGDKLLAYGEDMREENPAMGLRSIRFSLRHKDVFTGQLRALLRAASDEAPLRIMLPMITSVEEFREAAALVDECMNALAEAGHDDLVRPELGIMVEVPSAVEMVDVLAKEADFLSVGTNDLIQFLLAADRTNDHVAHYFVPHHPAVLRALARVARAGAAAGIDVSVCGEMAHEEAYLAFLLGVGVRTLSVDPHFLPALQERIATLDLDEAAAKAASALEAATVAEAAERLGLS